MKAYIKVSTIAMSKALSKRFSKRVKERKAPFKALQTISKP
jgi:hypothetical protein